MTLTSRILIKILRLRFFWLFSLFLLAKTKIHGNFNLFSKTVLCLSKPIFVEDLNSIASLESKINLISFPKIYLTYLFYAFIPAYARFDDANFWDVIDTEEDKILAAAVQNIFKYYLFFTHFSAIVSSNYCYCNQQHLMKWSRNNSIPFVVLYKEGLLLKYRPIVNLRRLFVGKYCNASSILFYNYFAKSTFENHSEGKFENVMLRVTGVPRFDRYKNDINSREDIIFFYFSPIQKVRSLAVDNQSDCIESLEKSIIGIIISLNYLYQRNHIFEFRRFIVKFKNQLELNEFLGICKKYSLNEYFLQFLELDCFSCSSSLILSAHTVIGYFSTTLIEASLASCRILTPSIDDPDSLDSSDFISRVGAKEIDFKHSPNLFHALNEAEPRGDLQKITNVSEFCGYDDGLSSQRVIIYLEQLCYGTDGAKSLE